MTMMVVVQLDDDGGGGGGAGGLPSLYLFCRPSNVCLPQSPRTPLPIARPAPRVTFCADARARLLLPPPRSVLETALRPITPPPLLLLLLMTSGLRNVTPDCCT